MDKQNIEDILGLTAMQEGMLFHHLANPRSKQYFEQISLGLSGKICSESFTKAWQAVVQTNEMLRTVFKWRKLDKPVQIVLKTKQILIRIVDLSDSNGEEQRQLIEKIKKDDRDEDIDLTRAPFRIILCLLNHQNSELVLTYHHMVCDGWSNGIILKEFLQAYNRLCNGKEPLEIHKTKYKAFLQWYGAQPEDRQKKFWESCLQGFDTRTLLPYNEKTSRSTGKVTTHKIRITPLFRRGLFDFCRDHNVTFSTLIYGTWGILLQKYNNSDDVIFGTTVSGRSAAVKGINDMVGLFINTLPLRFKAVKQDKALDILHLLSRHLRERTAYEHTPLTEIKPLTCFGSKENLFDSIIVIDNYPLPENQPGERLGIRSYDLFEITNFDLTVQVLVMDTLDICFHYHEELFEPGTIKRLAGHFFHILEEVGKTIEQVPGKKLSDIVMLSGDEKKQVLEEFNNPDIQYIVDKTIHGVIEDQVKRTPHHSAVQFEDTWLTYRELNRRVNQLAHLLGEYGVVPGADPCIPVAVLFPRSVDMIAAVLGILKAGGACIPLDISYPEERNSFIVKDSGAGLVLTPPAAGRDNNNIPGVTRVIFQLEKLNMYPTNSPETSQTVQPGDLSYIIYTSGSTGKPKGTLLHHSGIVNHTYTKIHVLGITGTDTVANNFSINVIASVWQVLAPLFTGARLLVYPEEVEWDPYLQFQRVEADGVTVIEVIPPVLKAYLFLLDEGKEKISLGKLRKIALTSEETKPFLVNKFYEQYTHIDLVDCYGQTECCDDVLHYTIPRDTNTCKVPIGTPSLNTHVFIMNHHDQLQPVGVVGEICVSGAGVAYGYWKRPELTAEKFSLDKSFSGVQGAVFQKSPLVAEGRIYKTGDLGRWLPDGRVEYLGRVDHQVKIRGNRVELREIENQVIRYPAVKEAAVVAREDREGEKSLYAFFVSREAIAAPGIRQFLLKTLPDYMVPAHFVPLERLALTPNGKIDRKALVQVEIKGSIGTGTEYKPPRSEFEKKIQGIWCQLLDKEEIGINDNFFDLGGHSLLLIKLKSRLEKTFHFSREISIVQLFNYPTIALQARYFAGEPEDGETEVVEQAGEAADSDLAVIGISLRVPGARDIHEFWDNISAGIEGVSFFEEDELENPGGSREVRGQGELIPVGGIIGDIDLFDADFFGYTPREAEIMDPQQRLFLEHAWWALEDAGCVGETYPGTVGVYAGVGWNAYLLGQVLANPGVIGALGEFQTMIANDKDFLATRVSYKLNLKGPALTVQTACSSSLSAVHLARQGLLNGDCDMALAGGIYVRVPEKSGYLYIEGGHLSPDGHCRPFDAKAKGTVFSSGVAVVVLKPLANALQDRDQLYAVLKGSAMNNDGSLKVGFTSPSEVQQSKVVTKALLDAGIDPGTIGYIETHGTGTLLGDPVEISALTHAFRTVTDAHDQPGQNKKQYCALGSVKANIGHLDVAAGIVGFIKAVLCLKYKQIPPTLHFETPNPLTDFENSPFFVNRTLKDWPLEEAAPGTLRRAGVNSLGIGGTNVHVILEEAPPVEQSSQSQSRHWKMIMFSAKTADALHRAVDNFKDYLHKNPGIDAADAAYTLQVGRAGFQYRGMFLCSDVNEAASALANSEKIATSFVEAGDKPVIFMFPGQGSQYVNMALELYRTEPVFRAEMDRCFEILRQLLDDDLKEIIYPAVNRSYRSYRTYSEKINRTEITQPVLFAVEYALAKLLITWGIRPYAMIGHSIGEYTAACLSGVLSLEDALKLVSARGRLMQQMPPGAMLSVPLAEEDLVPLLKEQADRGDELSLAAVNASSLCVVSGTHDAIDRFEELLQSKGYDCSRLHTSHAFHSPMMDPLLKEFAKIVGQVRFNQPRIPYISNLTGDWLDNREVTDPDYWVRHVRRTVRFADGVKNLLAIESPVFIEVGPGRVLSTFVRQHAEAGKKDDLLVVHLVRHPRKHISDSYYLLEQIGQLWLKGVEINWKAFYAGEARRRISLPTYPFEKKPYWLQPAVETVEKVNKNKKEDIDHWFYFPVWRQSAPPAAAPLEKEENRDRETCRLFFLDECGVGLRLIDLIEKKEGALFTVSMGKQFESRGNGAFTIRPDRCEDYISLLEQVQARGKTIDQVVHLWMVSRDGAHSFAEEKPGEWLDRGVYSLLYLVQALEKKRVFNQMELWVISNQVQQIEKGDCCIPGKAVVLGPLAVISQEYPYIVCRGVDVDLDTAVEPLMMENLVSELETPSADRIIAYRGAKRWTRWFEPLKLPAGSDIPGILRKHGVYLLVGGLGRIGMNMAEYLARAVQARLVLTDRRPMTGEQAPVHSMMRIKNLEEAGAEVLVLQADVTDKEQMKTVIHETEKKFGTLHGVIHSADVMDPEAFKPISQLDRKECEIHFKPKIQGVYVLAEVLKGRELDFCLLNASLSSSLGGLTLYAYSGANSFMDAFAREQTRVQGQTWLSIDWDEWQRESSPDCLGNRAAITGAEGIQALQRVLSMNVNRVPQVVVSCSNLDRRLRRWVQPGSGPGSTTAADEAGGGPGPKNTTAYKRDLNQNPYEEPQNEAEKIAAELWEQLLGIEPVGVEDDFFALGGHSLLATKLIARMREIFRIDLPLDILFDKPTIREVVDYVVDKWGDPETVEKIARVYRKAFPG